MRIALEPANQPEVVRLIEELDAYQMPLYPAESHHGIDVKLLSRSNVLFAVARNGEGLAVGCGAIVLCEGYGEVKRMYVRPSHRGQGIGKAILAYLESEARSRGRKRFALETGAFQPEALALYKAAGYKPCPPFGSYTEDANSVFLQKNAG